MYTAFDFINQDIESKHMKLGWKLEITKYGIALTHTMLNFDWKSMEFLGEEAWDLFLNSKSWKTLKEKEDRAMIKFKRLYFEANSIEVLKFLVETEKIKVDIDKMLERTIKKKSERIKEKREELSKLGV